MKVTCDRHWPSLITLLQPSVSVVTPPFPVPASGLSPRGRLMHHPLLPCLLFFFLPCFTTTQPSSPASFDPPLPLRTKFVRYLSAYHGACRRPLCFLFTPSSPSPSSDLASATPVFSLPLRGQFSPETLTANQTKRSIDTDEPLLQASPVYDPVIALPLRRLSLSTPSPCHSLCCGATTDRFILSQE